MTDLALHRRLMRMRERRIVTVVSEPSLSIHAIIDAACISLKDADRSRVELDKAIRLDDNSVGLSLSLKTPSKWSRFVEAFKRVGNKH